MSRPHDHLDALAAHMAVQLRLAGETIAQMEDAVRRRMPSRLEAALATVLHAEAVRNHPKLSRQVNTRTLGRAIRALTQWLDTLDPKAERRGEILDLVARLAFVLVVTALGVFFVLLWQGAIGPQP